MNEDLMSVSLVYTSSKKKKILKNRRIDHKPENGMSEGFFVSLLHRPPLSPPTSRGGGSDCANSTFF